MAFGCADDFKFCDERYFFALARNEQDYDNRNAEQEHRTARKHYGRSEALRLLVDVGVVFCLFYEQVLVLVHSTDFLHNAIHAHAVFDREVNLVAKIDRDRTRYEF